ncbi:MAG: CARDB domain-containing protein [Thermoplasmata archaeon]
MNNRKPDYLKLIGLVTTIILLTGAVFPSVGYQSTDSSEDVVSLHDLESIYGWDEGNVWYIDESITLEELDIPMDASIEINSTGRLELIDSTLTLLIDGYNPRDITLFDGGELILRNSTITTNVRGEGTVLRPFLKTNISAYPGSNIELLEGSSFKFPGWVYLENSDLTLKESTFEPLDEIPDFDYTWGRSERRVGEHDNNDCPRLIANMGSHVLIEDSEIIGNYVNDYLVPMEWYPQEYTGTPILEPGDNFEISLWDLNNPQFPSIDEGYPYVNPFDRISALFMEVQYRTEEEYDGDDSILYDTPDGLKQAIPISNTGGGLVSQETNIFEPGLDRINHDFTKDLIVSLENTGSTGENRSIVIEAINLYSAFDNDMHLWDSTMTVINSVIDIDFNPSQVNPKQSNSPTDNTNWMANADQKHRVIRVLESSNLRTYGLELPAGTSVPPSGDPAVVTDEDSTVNIYRWIQATAEDKLGKNLEGAEVTPSQMRGPFNDPESAHNEYARDYMERIYGTVYEDGTGYITGDDGRTVMFLLSDNITHPDNWPNSKYLGQNSLIGVFEDGEAGIGETTAVKDVSLPSFPNLVDNLIETNLTFDLELPGQAQLRVLDIIFDPSDTVEYGTDVFISAGIDNVGEVDVEGVNISFYYGGDMHWFGTRFVDVLGQGEEYRLTEPLAWDYPDAGAYDITVIADPHGEIDQQTEQDNERTETISVLTAADLEIVEFQLSHVNIYEGETLTIEATIENLGEYTSTGTYARFYADSDLIDDIYVPSLEGGETRDLSVEWEARMDTDGLTEEKTIMVELDGEEQSKGLTIMKPSLLSIDSDDIDFSTDLSQVGTSLDISARIYNDGSSVEATVRFYADGVLISSETADIPAQGTIDVSVTWNPSISGNRLIEIKVLVDGEMQAEASVTKPIFSQGYQRDLIVGGTGFPDERQIYREDIDGCVVIQGNGELKVTGTDLRAGIEFLMDEENQYSIFVRDQGSLTIDFGQLSSTHPFNIYLEGGQLVIENDSTIPSYVTLIARGDSTVRIDNTHFQGPMDFGGGLFEAEESQFTSQNVVLSPSNVDITNSTFTAPLVHFQDTIGSLTGVETGSIETTGDSEIKLYRWLRTKALSKTGLPIPGAEITAENLQVDYTSTGITDGQGVAYLKVFTDEITDRPRSRNHYELSAEYSPEGAEEVYSIAPFTEKLPSYNEQVYVFQVDMQFEDLVMPDLSISANGIYTAHPDDITLGEEIEIYADIGNVGETDAANVDVYFYNYNTGEEIGVDSLESVPLDDFITASVSWVPEMADENQPSEEVVIRVWIVPTVEPLTDPNPGNNEAFSTMMVRSPPKPEFDLMEIIMTVDGEPIEDNTVIERDEIAITVNIVNSGGTDLTGANIEFTFDEATIAQSVVDMPVGEVIEVSETWEVDVTGDLTVNANIVSDYENVSLERELTVEEMDIRIQDVSAPSEDIKIDDLITVVGDLVRDRDGKPVGDITIHAYLIDSDGNIVSEEQGETAAGGSFIIDLLAPDKGGTYRIRLLPDHPRGDSAEITTQEFEVIDPTEGIPLWMIALIIVVIVAVSLVGILFYLKYRGEGEWVECGECGSTIPAESNSCPKCGTEFEMNTVKCSECGEWIPGDVPKCPHCGVAFITTGKEVEDYTESMKKQYRKYVQKHKRLARRDIGDKFTKKEFMIWWSKQPSYLSFDDWLEQEETRRRKGGIECPQCGALNSIDEDICQKCSTPLVEFAPRKKEDTGEQEEEEELPLLGLDDIEKLGEEESEEQEPEEETEDDAPRKGVVKKVKKQPKRVSKMVKKKVVKKPSDEE